MTDLVTLMTLGLIGALNAPWHIGPIPRRNIGQLSTTFTDRKVRLPKQQARRKAKQWEKG